MTSRLVALVCEQAGSELGQKSIPCQKRSKVGAGVDQTGSDHVECATGFTNRPVPVCRRSRRGSTNIVLIRTYLKMVESLEEASIMRPHAASVRKPIGTDSGAFSRGTYPLRPPRPQTGASPRGLGGRAVEPEHQDAVAPAAAVLSQLQIRCIVAFSSGANARCCARFSLSWRMPCAKEARLTNGKAASTRRLWPPRAAATRWGSSNFEIDSN